MPDCGLVNWSQTPLRVAICNMIGYKSETLQDCLREINEFPSVAQNWIAFALWLMDLAKTKRQ